MITTSEAFVEVAAVMLRGWARRYLAGMLGDGRLGGWRMGGEAARRLGG